MASPKQHMSEKRKRSAGSTSKVFSDEDEIALLKGYSNFEAIDKKNRWVEFHLFVKDDLHTEFTKLQVSEKIRSLKKRFFTCSGKVALNLLDLSDDTHATTVFELSKELWGDEFLAVAPKNEDRAVDETETVNVKTTTKKKKPERELFEDGGEGNAIAANINTNPVEDGKISYDDFERSYPLLYASLSTPGQPMILKEKCVLIGREKAQELEERWRQYNAVMLDLEHRKLQFMLDQVETDELAASSTD